MNWRKRGDAGVGLAIAYFATRGYTVSIPLTDSQDYDLVADIDGTLSRVQVRTVSCLDHTRKYQVNLVVKGGNRSGTGKIKVFDQTRVELLIVCTDDGSMYCIPSSEIKGKTTLSVGGQLRKEFLVSNRDMTSFN